MSNYHCYKEKTIKLLPYDSLYGGHIPLRKIEPPFLAVHLKKFQTSSVMKVATFHIKRVATTSLQNINWLSKKVQAVHIKGGMSIVPAYIPSSYNVFLYFLKGQVHKDSN